MKRFMKKKRQILLIVMTIVTALFNISAAYGQDVLINEVMASNFKKVYDENTGTPDWIELYNPSGNTIHLKGYRISDKDDFEHAWSFPDTVILPHSHITVFASGENRCGSNTLVIESPGMPFYYSFDNDDFSFAYIPISGNFEFTVEISSMINPSTQSQAILMLRENLTNTSKYAGIVCLNPIQAGSFILQSRKKEKTLPEDIIMYNTSPDYPHCKFRLKRSNDDIYGYIQTERFFWNVNKKIKFHSDKDTLYLGIGFASGKIDRSAKLNIKHIILNNDTVPCDSLRFKSINTPYPGKMYYSNELHTDFKLSRKGDTVYLWNPRGERIDKVILNKQLTNVSYGRFPDGGVNFSYMTESTFGKANMPGFIRICKKPEFSVESGMYDKPVNVKIINEESNSVIYYTLDGSTPDRHSFKYTNTPIHITKTTVIRAQTMKSEFIPSAVNTNTYFINDSASLPVISLVTDSINLYGDKGIFNKKNYDDRRIEIPVNFEIFDTNKNLIFESAAGAKLSGQATVTFPQKSIRVYARNLYNKSSFDYPFFGENGLQKYKTLIFRNGGNTWSRTFLRDGFSNVLSQQLPYSQGRAFQPAIMFINGKYYGIQNIRERLDASYFHLKYKIPEDSINIIDDLTKHKAGITYDYFSTLNTIIAMDISNSEAYKYLDSHIDLNNFIDFFIFQVFIANTDWPWKNQQMWSSSSLDNKWRWNFTDMDFTFGINSWPSYDMFFKIALDTIYHFPKLFLKVLENNIFKNRFLNRTADLYNTVFKPRNVLNVFDSLATIIQPEIPRHHAKYNSSVNNWNKEISDVRNYIKSRYRQFTKAFIKYFHLSGVSRLTVTTNIPEDVKIRINSITVDTSYMSGIYFNDVPVEIEVIGGKDEDFLGWSDKSLAKKRKVTVILSDSLKLIAIFDKINPDKQLVINEIMYKPAEKKDCEDWFEIYNPNDYAINLSGYLIKDNKDEHSWKFPSGTEIEAKGFLVVSNDIDDFYEVYPAVKNVVGEFDFGLGKKDQIRLFDFSGRLIDSVSYSNKSPWPENAYGTGNTIELISYNKDNNKGENWKCSDDILGSPGRDNLIADTFDNKNFVINRNLLIYPNPADRHFYIELQANSFSHATLSIYNSKGNLARQTEAFEVNAGLNNHKFDISHIPSGIYTIVVNIEGQILTQRLLIIR
jgi:hypothetical protein